MTWYLKPDFDTYEDARILFDYDIPEKYNIAWDMVRKHPNPRSSVAVFQAYPDGRRETYTIRDLDVLSDRFGNALLDMGIERGDRVAVMLSHQYQAMVAHYGCWKIGAVTIPLTTQFGTSALRYRLRDSDSRVLVFDASVRETVSAVADDCEDLDHLLEVDGDGSGGYPAFDDVVGEASRDLTMVETTAKTPAMIPYTSGTTGDPKGVLHAHEVAAAFAPGLWCGWGPDMEDEVVMWTPQDFGWIGGMCWMWMMGHFGHPMVLYPMGKFDIHSAFEIMEEFGVTFTFLPPTGIRMMMQVDDPTENYDLELNVVGSAGEPVTPEIPRWVEDELGAVFNEGYGQTEATTIVGECRSWFEPRKGTMGRAMPGHEVAVVDPETGEEVPPGEVGEIAVRHDDPVVFEEYWNKPEKTEATRVGEWHLTGDLGTVDPDGFFSFVSRSDDVIITSGYRVGPSEIESIILEHDEVEQAAVIGVPHDVRGEIIKAVLQPVESVEEADHDRLQEEIQDLVRDELATYEYPREIEFVDELPTTTTRKVQRQALKEREGIR